MIYLDNAATTFPKPEEVYKALDKANRQMAFNAGRGSYSASKIAFSEIEEVRGKIANIAGLENQSDVVFTSSATDALNMIINGLTLEKGQHVYISPFEHNSIVRPLKNLEKKVGIKVHILSFSKETWLPNLNIINNEFAINRPSLILLSHISNATGYILPYERIFDLAKTYGSITVLDAAQSFGLIPFNQTLCDFIVFAGHKSLYASFGIAGFVSTKANLLTPTKFGGTGSDSLNPEMPNLAPYRFEAGSQNIVAISGLNAAIDWRKNNPWITNHEKKLTDYLTKKLSDLPNTILYKPNDLCTFFGILSFNIKGYRAEDVGLILSEDYNIAVRTGYHCAPMVHDFIGSSQHLGTVRVSVGAFTTEEDIDQLCKALATL